MTWVFILLCACTVLSAIAVIVACLAFAEARDARRGQRLVSEDFRRITGGWRA